MLAVISGRCGCHRPNLQILVTSSALLTCLQVLEFDYSRGQLTESNPLPEQSAYDTSSILRFSFGSLLGYTRCNKLFLTAQSCMKLQAAPLSDHCSNNPPTTCKSNTGIKNTPQNKRGWRTSTEGHHQKHFKISDIAGPFLTAARAHVSVGTRKVPS